MYYRNAAAAVVVYDITSAVGPAALDVLVHQTDATHSIQTSLEKAKSWVKELQRQANPNIVIAFSS